MITLPLRLHTSNWTLSGARWPDIEPFCIGDPIRQMERASIRVFMERHKRYLKGKVLDFGCGKQPYRDLVEGEYIGFEQGESLSDVAYSFDVVMCNQVVQYVLQPFDTLEHFWHFLKPGGHLLLTYPTNWDEVEDTDLHRFTKSGMDAMLRDARFKVLHHEQRAEVMIGRFSFSLGYGCVAQKS